MLSLELPAWTADWHL